MSSPSSENGIVFNIQRFCNHDGPGIRTTVFLKGCPLRCVWCHNPESHNFNPEISYSAKLCIGCGGCAAVCPNGCHTVENGHVYDRTKCVRCGQCIESCPGALEKMGRTMSVEEVLKEVEADRVFYGKEGGMTLSGGEPFARPAFALALLKGAKTAGLTTCVETCGDVPFEVLEEALPYVDLFLWDCKETDPELHLCYTGVRPDRILKNLEGLDRLGARIVLRCPILPGYNDRADHLAALGALAEKHENVLRIEVEPGHTIGEAKRTDMGYGEGIPAFESPTKEQVEAWIHAIAAHTQKPVKRS